jgi:hypothetical protein
MRAAKSRVSLNPPSSPVDDADMSKRFLPVREHELNNWLANFAQKISAAPGTYGLTVGDSAAVSAAVSLWHAAFTAASAPTTRTGPAVQEKRNAKRHVTAVVRPIAAKVRANDDVSSELKLGLGLVLRSRAPVPAPQTHPVLGLRKMDTRRHILDAHDIVTGRGGKPDRVAGLVVFRAVGEGVAPHPGSSSADGLSYLGLFTRPRFTSEFTTADRGKTATYFARWVNAKGEPGPWSFALSVAIAA